MDNQELMRLKDIHWCIYETTIMDHKFIWRELSRSEFNKAVRYFPDEHEREEFVCKACLIEPKEFDFSECYAGVPTTLAKQILAESGFSVEPTGKLQRVLGKYRAEMESFQHQVSCIIHEAFPMLDIQNVETWSLEKTLWYYSRAEYKLNALRGMELQQVESGASSSLPQNQSGSHDDFPELAEQKAFIDGKMKKS